MKRLMFKMFVFSRPKTRAILGLMRLNFLSVVALELVRSLRRHGQALPVVVLGPHSAFRTAVDVARLDGTDFLERPVSAQRLRAALHKVTAVAEDSAKR